MPPYIATDWQEVGTGSGTGSVGGPVQDEGEPLTEEKNIVFSVFSA